MKKQIELRGAEMAEFLEGLNFENGIPNIKLSHITGGAKRIEEGDNGEDFITLHFIVEG